jgi:hypothetical protein
MILHPPGGHQGLPRHAADDQEGRRRPGQVVPMRLEGARLEAEPLGREQDPAHARPAVGRRRRCPDLGQGERPVEHPAELGEREELAIGRGCGARRTALGRAPAERTRRERPDVRQSARQISNGRRALARRGDVRSGLADEARVRAHVRQNKPKSRILSI